MPSRHEGMDSLHSKEKGQRKKEEEERRRERGGKKEEGEQTREG